MSNAWYISDHGRAKGPITTEELILKIRQGELTLVDLVFKEGSGGWQPVGNYKELSNQVNNTSIGATSNDADWIILRVVEIDGLEKYEQIGPYTVEEVLELVDAGRIKFNDFVWKTGFENWVPLGKLDKFDKPLASSIPVDHSLYSKPHSNTDQGSKSAPVKAYSPKQKTTDRRDDKKPDGVDGPDLAQPRWIMASTEKTNTKQSKTETPIKEKAIFDFGQSITNLLSPLKGPKRAPTGLENEVKTGNPLKFEAVDIGERTQVLPKDAVVEAFPKRKAKNDIVSETKEKLEAVPEATSTAIPRVVVTKVVAKKETIPAELKDSAENLPEIKEEVIAPSPEVLEIMQTRWSRVLSATAVIILILGIGVSVFIIKKKWGNSNSAVQIAFEKHPPLPTLSQFEKPLPVKEQEESKPKSENSDAGQVQETSQLPPPDIGVPQEEPVVVKKPSIQVKDTAVGEVKKSKEVKATDTDSTSTFEVSQMSEKQKSFFHEQERMFIFYNSKKGLNLANLLMAALQKKNKTEASWRKFYGVWQTQIKNLSSKIKSELNSPKVHIKLSKEFKTAVADLEKRGKDINSQMVSGRAPTKDPTVLDIIAEFKKINANAKSLDQ